MVYSIFVDSCRFNEDGLQYLCR